MIYFSCKNVIKVHPDITAGMLTFFQNFNFFSKNNCPKRKSKLGQSAYSALRDSQSILACWVGYFKNIFSQFSNGAVFAMTYLCPAFGSICKIFSM